MHLSFYPIGAGVFTGAAFALVTSAVVALLVAVGIIPDIKHDFSQFALTEGLSRDAFDTLVTECLKERSLLFTIVAEGFGDGYSKVKWPFGHISNIRPLAQLLYIVIAAIIFMAAVDRRKPVVYGMVVLAGLIVAGAISELIGQYMIRNYKNPSGCRGELLVERAKDRMAEGLAKHIAQHLQAALDKENGVWRVSVQAEGRSLIHSQGYRRKKPIPIERGWKPTVDERVSPVGSSRSFRRLLGALMILEITASRTCVAIHNTRGGVITLAPGYNARRVILVICPHSVISRH